MEKINNTLKRLAGNKNFQENYQKMREEILNNSYVKSFLHEHQNEITNDLIEKNLNEIV